MSQSSRQGVGVDALFRNEGNQSLLHTPSLGEVPLCEKAPPPARLLVWGGEASFAESSMLRRTQVDFSAESSLSWIFSSFLPRLPRKQSCLRS